MTVVQFDQTDFLSDAPRRVSDTIARPAIPARLGPGVGPMAAPFKRPRFNDDSAAGAIMAPPPVPPRRAAAESAPSHHAKRAPSVTSDSSAGSSSTIFGKTSDSSSAGKDNDGRARAVVDSASQVVKRALMAMPKVTQPVKKPLRFRRKVSKDEDVDWVFKNVGSAAFCACRHSIAVDGERS